MNPFDQVRPSTSDHAASLFTQGRLGTPNSSHLSISHPYATNAAAYAHTLKPPHERTQADEILSRLQICIEIIKKEYSEYNTKHSTRESKRTIPQLFYSFAVSPLCTNFILACHDYLMAFLRTPVKEGQTLADPNLAELNDHMQRVAAAWGAILLFRSDMNRYETLTISHTMKKSEHFLNDTFDQQFFETLALLVEYVIEFRFMDEANRQANIAAAAKQSNANATTNGNSTSPPNGTESHVSPSSSSAPSSTTPTSSASSNSSKSLYRPLGGSASLDATWRRGQHELQRILRSRSFSHSQKQHAPDRSRPHGSRGNGLQHIPIGSAANPSNPNGSHSSHTATSSRRYPGKTSTSYRNPATFALFGRRRWNDPQPEDDFDDTRALSHLPGQFQLHAKGQHGILECLDLRSPIVSSILPNPRSLHHANDKYVFGSEERSANAKRQFHGRLTLAEEKYLTQQHARQAQREAEWKARLEKEANDEVEEKQEISSQQFVKEASHTDTSSTIDSKSTEHASTANSIPSLLLPTPPPPPPQPTPPSVPYLSLPSSDGLSPVPSVSSSSRSGRLQATISGSQTQRSTRLASLSSNSSSSSPHPSGASTARRLTLEEKLASSKPIVKVVGNKISLADFDLDGIV